MGQAGGSPTSWWSKPFSDGESVRTVTLRLTEQLHFVLWTLHQDRADRVQVVVVAAAQRAGPGLRDLEKGGQSVGVDSKGRLSLRTPHLQSSGLRLCVLSLTGRRNDLCSPTPGA